MRIRAAALAMIVCLIAAGPSIAHQDTVLTLRSNGVLNGLPTQYQPAAIEIGPIKSDPTGRPVPRVVVRLSGVESILKPCVAELFLLPKDQSLRIHGSWYHDFSILPPYVVVDLPSQTIEDEWFSGYTVLFDLRTAKIIELHQVVVTPISKFGTISRRIPAYKALCEGGASSIWEVPSSLLPKVK